MEGIGPVVILCGGRGTRLQERTHAIPKALVEIGDRPILWHVIRIYAAQGLRRFLLLTGYLGEMIEEFVIATDWPEPVEIDCVDTGLDTPTGGRIALVRERLTGQPFCATYADGVADLDLEPRTQFGVAELDPDDRVLGFEEKPRLDHWVNGGFFCLEPGFLDYLATDSVLERAPLRHLAAAGQLRAFRHTGFWECMDTYKDAVMLNDLWGGGQAPWAVWERDTATEAGAL
ncbi:MAG: nucleotidyl transferase [Actinobacteria bacterium]|nr:MAG: nucleotidyl transferase [Actinomycetota bacterium]